MIGNRIADKITSVSKKKSNNEYNNSDDDDDDNDVELTTHKKNTYPQKRKNRLLKN